MRNRNETRAGGDESWRWDGVPAHWGQIKTFDSTATASQLDKVVWVAGQRHIVLDVPPPEVWRVPQVQTIMLGAVMTGPPTSVFFPRWELQLGVGGARSTFLLDAQKLQQVTAPAATVRASFYLDAVSNVFTVTDVVANVLAYEADGNSNTTPAQYTDFIAVGAGANVSFVIPKGATRVRVLGGPTSPEFAATTVYGFKQFNSTLDVYLGTDLLAIHVAGGFLPIPAAATQVNVQVGGGAAIVAAFLLYELEL